MASSEAIDVLRSIDASLKQIVKLLASGAAASQGGAVASDRELDSQYGNPKVTFNPRGWSGPPFKGRKFSECSADFLDVLAETLDYLASKAAEKDERTDKGKPVAEYKRKDAARARGWAKRIREGKVAATPAASAPIQGARRVPAAWSQDVDAGEGSEGAEDDSPFSEADTDAPLTAADIFGGERR